MEMLDFIFKAMLYLTGILFLAYIIDAIVKAHISNKRINEQKEKIAKSVDEQILNILLEIDEQDKKSPKQKRAKKTKKEEKK